jgi:hypothetical protein
VIIGLNKRDATVFDPCRLSIITGEIAMLEENPGNWKLNSLLIIF